MECHAIQGPLKMSCLTDYSHVVHVSVPSRITLREQYESVERILNVYSYCHEHGIDYTDYKRLRNQIKWRFLQRAIFNRDPQISNRQML